MQTPSYESCHRFNGRSEISYISRNGTEGVKTLVISPQASREKIVLTISASPRELYRNMTRIQPKSCHRDGWFSCYLDVCTFPTYDKVVCWLLIPRCLRYWYQGRALWGREKVIWTLGNFRHWAQCKKGNKVTKSHKKLKNTDKGSTFHQFQKKTSGRRLRISLRLRSHWHAFFWSLLWISCQNQGWIPPGVGERSALKKAFWFDVKFNNSW